VLTGSWPRIGALVHQSQAKGEPPGDTWGRWAMTCPGNPDPFKMLESGHLQLRVRGERPGIRRQSPRLPRNPFHPGEILIEEFLVPAEITQTAFAEKIGWSRSRLSEFIHGKRGVTADAAIDLAEAQGTTSKLLTCPVCRTSSYVSETSKFSSLGQGELCFGGAGDRTRTCTPRAVAPKATASTNSATPAPAK
jgi:addiction module HigA family antidote